MLSKNQGAKMKEKIIMFIAWRLPKSLVYWCTYRVFAYATMGKYGDTIVPELTCMDALQRWENE